MQYKNPANRSLVLEGLKMADRMDLVGFGPKCLIRPERKNNDGGKAGRKGHPGEKNSAGNRKGKSREVSGKNFAGKSVKKENHMSKKKSRETCQKG